MVRKAHGRWKGLGLCLCLTLVCWAYPAEAQQIGNWPGYFPYLGEIYFFDYPMTVGQDGSVTLVTTADSSFLNQFSSTGVLDGSENTIDSTSLTTSPKTLVVPLAAGSYTARIARGNTDKYGNYTITANLAPANPGATETENNDLIADANTNPDNLFAGAIGYIRAMGLKDLSDYYRFTLTGDTNVHFALTTADTLVSSDTALTLRNGSDVGMDSTYFSSASKTWDLHLAAGAYYLNLYTHDFSRYGGYTITTTTTPRSTHRQRPRSTTPSPPPIPSKRRTSTAPSGTGATSRPMTTTTIFPAA